MEAPDLAAARAGLAPLTALHVHSVMPPRAGDIAFAANEDHLQARGRARRLFMLIYKCAGDGRQLAAARARARAAARARCPRGACLLLGRKRRRMRAHARNNMHTKHTNSRAQAQAMYQAIVRGTAPREHGASDPFGRNTCSAVK